MQENYRDSPETRSQTKRSERRTAALFDDAVSSRATSKRNNARSSPWVHRSSSFAFALGRSFRRETERDSNSKSSAFEPFVEKCHRKRGRGVGQTRRHRRRRRRNRNPTKMVVDLIINRARRRNVKERGREEEEITVNAVTIPTARLQRRSEAE